MMLVSEIKVGQWVKISGNVYVCTAEGDFYGLNKQACSIAGEMDLEIVQPVMELAQQENEWLFAYINCGDWVLCRGCLGFKVDRLRALLFDFNLEYLGRDFIKGNEVVKLMKMTIS